MLLCGAGWEGTRRGGALARAGGRQGIHWRTREQRLPPHDARPRGARARGCTDAPGAVDFARGVARPLPSVRARARPPRPEVPMAPRRVTVDHTKGIPEVAWALFGELSRALAPTGARDYD